VHGEIQPAFTRCLTGCEHLIDRVDGAVLGAAKHRHAHQHRLPLAGATFQRVVQRGGVKPHVLGGQQRQLVTPEAEQLQALAP
jgi:hypothetical protein